MNTYSFKINAVDAKVSLNGLSNVITTVHYTHIVQDEHGNEYGRNDAIVLPEPQPENFIAVDDLVQADVISWIEPLLDLDALQVALDAKLAEKITPSVVRLIIPETNEPVVEEPVVEQPPYEVPNIGQ